MTAAETLDTEFCGDGFPVDPGCLVGKNEEVGMGLENMEKKEKGILSIKTSMVGNNRYVKIEFSDNGCGIKKKDISKIFDPDFSTKPGGNGLGLWLIKSYLEQMDSIIYVDSKFRNGTTFTIIIPIG